MKEFKFQSKGYFKILLSLWNISTISTKAFLVGTYRVPFFFYTALPPDYVNTNKPQSYNFFFQSWNILNTGTFSHKILGRWSAFTINKSWFLIKIIIKIIVANILTIQFTMLIAETFILYIGKNHQFYFNNKGIDYLHFYSE